MSRLLLANFLEWNDQGHIQLQVNVLTDSGPDLEDSLLQFQGREIIRWFGGKRFEFAIGMLKPKPDLIIFDHSGLARLPGLLPKLIRPPYIAFIHGIEIWKQNRRDYYRSAKNARMLIANSDYTARKSRSRFPDLPQIQVCHPGMDALVEDPESRESVPVDIGSQAMLIVGRLDSEQRHKGHDALLEAMPLILKKVPSAQLIVVGGGDDQQRLEKKAEQLGLAKNVVFKGWCNRSVLKTLYSRCALFVMPSDGDGFGLVFLEAMMNGLPCVGQTGSAAQEIFQDKVSGVLVDRDDIEEMANKLAELLNDPGKRQALAESALLRYRTRFRAENFSQRLRDVLLRKVSSESFKSM